VWSKRIHLRAGVLREKRGINIGTNNFSAYASSKGNNRKIYPTNTRGTGRYYCTRIYE